MKIGYVGVAAADDRTHSVQTFELKAAGCSSIYLERFTISASNRPRLQAMLGSLRPGDVVVVTKLERLARSTPDLFDIVGRIKSKGASLEVLDLLGSDARARGGDLVPLILDTIAAFDRRTSGARDVERPAVSKPRQKPVLALADEAEIRRLRTRGFGPMRIARKLKIVPASVYGALVARSGA
ncbi:MAG TPA: recombinase family protein [Hyphomonadaceae bacterium]|nr:recombinase family protein [Hyphomonadaceae bacterium]